MCNRKVLAWCLIGSVGAAAMAGALGRDAPEDQNARVARRGSSRQSSVEIRAAGQRSLRSGDSVTERSLLAPLGEKTAPLSPSPQDGSERDATNDDRADPLLCDQPPEYCQVRGGENANLSNRTNFVIADRFSSAQSGSITEICWWGVYHDPGVGGPCPEPRPDDTFEVKYYADANGLPGALMDSFSQTGGTLTVAEPVDTGETVVDHPEYEYTATHAAVDVQADACYWIEISNSVSDSSNCLWYWEHSYAGDGRIYQDGEPPDGYTLQDVIFDLDDQAFCVGLPLQACQVWPANDDCANSASIADGVIYYFDTTNATTDGDEEPFCAFEIGDDEIARDIWFDYEAVCTGPLYVSLCGSLYDTRLAVYAGDDCPMPQEDPVACNDDYCGPPDEPYQSEVMFPVVTGDPYKIRAGGFSSPYGTAGDVGRLKVRCGEASPYDDCEDVVEIQDLHRGESLAFSGDNEFASNDCDLIAGKQVWIAFNLVEEAMVTVEYCDTSPAFANAGNRLVRGCPCTEVTDKAGCDYVCDASGNSNPFLSWECLPAGEYYYPVLSEPYSEGPYAITVSAYDCDRCTDAPGDCFEAHGTPGCDDPECCSLVCEADPCCCSLGWDQLCVELADPLCGGFAQFCAEATGDCCEAHAPGAGCGEPECCTAVCECSSFCCVVEWDVWCANEGYQGDGCGARLLCGPLCHGCPDGEVTFDQPQDGFVDSRQPHTVDDAANLKGVRLFTVSAPLNITDKSCWSVHETNQNEAMHPDLQPPAGSNTVMALVDDGGGSYTIKLQRAIAHGEVATITYDNTALNGSTVVAATFIYHPADVNNGDHTSNADDISALIESLDGTTPLPNERADVNRDGQQGPADILRLIDLLNGAGAFMPWLDVTVNE